MSTSAASVFYLGDSFSLGVLDTWPIWFSIVYCGIIYLGLEILSHIVHILFGFAAQIPIRGKHLDEFNATDKLYININKVFTMIFVYHVIYVTYNTPSIEWASNKVTWKNTICSLVGFYVVYDFFYMWFHRILHIRWLYPLIHKHHHRQKAPSRGNLDAINVHPFEYVVGEYLHLLVIWAIPCHIYTVAMFILLGGIFASLNHTRHDIRIPPYIYEVRVHDVHHRKPELNYGQYIMLWDRIFGSYEPYLECKDKMKIEDQDVMQVRQGAQGSGNSCRQVSAEINIDVEVSDNDDDEILTKSTITSAGTPKKRNTPNKASNSTGKRKSKSLSANAAVFIPKTASSAQGRGRSKSPHRSKAQKGGPTVKASANANASPSVKQGRSKSPAAKGKSK
jgi:sterol desaturase/sphingolipid hydroxylase (fatty acid hydroxylase superfamily)